MTDQSQFSSFLLHPGNSRTLRQFLELILVSLLVGIEKHTPQECDLRTT
jgi:hypothetical protein